MQNNQRNLIFEALPYPVMLLDKQLCLLDLNPEAELLLGKALRGVKGKELTTWLHKDCQLVAFLQRLQPAQGTRVESGLSLEFSQGSQLIVDVRVAVLSADEYTEATYVLSLFPHAFPYRQGTANDAQQGKAQQLPLATLVAMLAHEIKNPLSGIKGAAQLLEMSVSPDEADLPKMIIDEVDRLNKLLDEMEVFSDTRQLALANNNIHSVLRYCQGLAEAGYAKGIQFVTTYDPSLPDLLCDKDQLIQVFINLVKNAAEAIADKPNGVISLSTAYESGFRLKTKTHKTTQVIRVSVEDNGGGIPAAVQDSLFQPSVSSKQGGKGFGLALASKIVAAHEGWIDFKSEDRRTKFSVYLPLRSMAT